MNDISNDINNDIVDDIRDVRDLIINAEPVSLKDLGMQPYRKKPVKIMAAQINVAFEVKTMEGLIKGKPGDYLIIGVHGEAYPCDQAIFKETYAEPGPTHAVFQCCECEHLLYIEPGRISDLAKTDCPECGENPDGNWYFERMGDYDEEVAAVRVIAKNNDPVKGGTKHD